MVELINSLIIRRHYWRNISMDELSELYIAMMLRSLGLSIIGIFVPIYLYQLGFSLADIALLFAFTYGIRIPLDIVSAKITGIFGPKHIMILSQLFLFCYLIFLSTIETHNWPLWTIGVFFALTSSLFFTAYHIDFSKIKSSKSGGSQLSRMYIYTALAGALGPLLGGAVATLTDIRYSFFIALLIIAASSIPLTLSAEPVKRNQNVTFKGFPWKKIRRDLISNAGIGFNQMTQVMVWPLYISIFIFTDNIYLSVGFITTLSLFITIFSAKAFGKVIDKRQGKTLLNISAAGTSLANVLRLFVTTGVGVVLFNFIADPLRSGLHMPFTQGLYDRASSIPGYRDIYIGVILSSSNIVRTIFWLIVFAVAVQSDEKTAFYMAFIVSAITVWLVTTQKFKALQ